MPENNDKKFQQIEMSNNSVINWEGARDKMAHQFSKSSLLLGSMGPLYDLKI